jgi:hypothetical protein
MVRSRTQATDFFLSLNTIKSLNILCTFHAVPYRTAVHSEAAGYSTSYSPCFWTVRVPSRLCQLTKGFIPLGQRLWVPPVHVPRQHRRQDAVVRPNRIWPEFLKFWSGYIRRVATPYAVTIICYNHMKPSVFIDVHPGRGMKSHRLHQTGEGREFTTYSLLR